jgi:hypothetical protein
MHEGLECVRLDVTTAAIFVFFFISQKQRPPKLLYQTADDFMVTLRSSLKQDGPLVPGSKGFLPPSRGVSMVGLLRRHPLGGRCGHKGHFSHVAAIFCKA